MLRSRERDRREDLTAEETEEIEGRIERVRRRSNVIFALSFMVALGVHVLVFRFGPTFETALFERNKGPGVIDVPVGGDSIGIFLNVMFYPPDIFTDSGELRTEPPERVLDARHVNVAGVLSSEPCEGRDRGSVAPVAGRVKVRVNEHGRVVRAEVRESTGDPCRDAVIAGIASSVWYRWLPNDAVPAPVDLIQPMRVTMGGM